MKFVRLECNSDILFVPDSTVQHGARPARARGRHERRRAARPGGRARERHAALPRQLAAGARAVPRRPLGPSARLVLGPVCLLLLHSFGLGFDAVQVVQYSTCKYYTRTLTLRIENA